MVLPEGNILTKWNIILILNKLKLTIKQLLSSKYELICINSIWMKHSNTAIKLKLRQMFKSHITNIQAKQLVCKVVFKITLPPPT